MCPSDKNRHATEIDAMIALADTQSALRKAARSERRVYRCPLCAGWHLTSAHHKKSKPDD